MLAQLEKLKGDYENLQTQELSALSELVMLSSSSAHKLVKGKNTQLSLQLEHDSIIRRLSEAFTNRIELARQIHELSTAIINDMKGTN